MISKNNDVKFKNFLFQANLKAINKNIYNILDIMFKEGINKFLILAFVFFIVYNFFII